MAMLSSRCSIRLGAFSSRRLFSQEAVQKPRTGGSISRFFKGVGTLFVRHKYGVLVLVLSSGLFSLAIRFRRTSVAKDEIIREREQRIKKLQEELDSLRLEQTTRTRLNTETKSSLKQLFDTFSGCLKTSEQKQKYDTLRKSVDQVLNIQPDSTTFDEYFEKSVESLSPSSSTPPTRPPSNSTPKGFVGMI
eukprot:TRINITY_DN2832_c0_g1_i2.p1 TRINITY_DN2832_c0_g1~~TRINITY_DN2832_c0_g1_i2.p1  ORF type:complete len:191 (+),score=14.90 TRINITY_DN2832_c0_g1_i2:39-611(+)